MNFFLRNLLDRFDMLSVRERLLVLIAVVVLLVVVWDTAFSAPREKERRARLQQVQALRAEVSGLEQSIEMLAAASDRDPDAGLNEEIRRLQAELPELDARLAGATSGLIGPEEMTQVLKQLLQQAARLEVRGLRTLEAARVMAENNPGITSPGARLFKHGLEIELAGNYLDILHFVQSMESLKWRFFWDQFDLEVEQHPRARVRLVVYTLSLEQGWIGV